MLQTIEVRIDGNGNVLPTEPIPVVFQGRALLTLLNSYTETITTTLPSHRVDRFDMARGSATIKWKTDELMQVLRGDD